MTDLSSMSDDDLKAAYAASAPVDPRTMSDAELKSAYDATAPAAGADGSMSWSDVGSQALQNIIPSAENFASNIAQPFIHPLKTAESIGNLELGTMQKLGLMGGTSYEKAPEQFGQAISDRYGGLDAFKKTLATDPVGAAGDLSALLSGGETALARAPGFLGDLGAASGQVSRAIDPLSAVSGAANLAGQGAAHTLGLTTGAGAQPFERAYSAGLAGRHVAAAFRSAMTGEDPMESVVNDARSAVSNMRQERGRAYRDAMQDIGTDPTILSWNDVDTALDDMDKVATYKGQSLSPSTDMMRNEIKSAVREWQNLQASEFWTPEGFDALKKQIGDLRDSSEPHTPARVVADQAYNAIRKTIIDQAPQYAQIMEGYSSASDQIKEIEKTLSLSPNATIDTALRKLQSTLRDNVNTSFGRRTELANYLANAGAPNLMEKLAGQALKSWTPRGLSRLGAMELIPAAAGALAHGATGAGAGVLATLPLTSPRLMGEAAYGAGKVAGVGKKIAPALRPARNIGRATQLANPFANPANGQ